MGRADAVRVVVTGATGFLGSALMRRLVDAGHEAIGVTRKSGTPHLQVAAYADAPLGEVLVHLAQDSDRARVNAMSATLEEEMGLTVRRLLTRGYARTIYVSSAILYGDEHSTPRQVSDPVAVTDAYARIKYTCEREVLGAEGLVVRMANLYGPGMAPSNVINKILGQIPGDGDLVVYDSTPVRDFIWVDDAAAALCAMLTSVSHRILNVGTGIGSSIHDLAKSALQSAGQADRQVRSSHPTNRHSYLVVDPALTTTLTGWTPTTGLDEGIENLLNIQNSQRA